MNRTTNSTGQKIMDRRTLSSGMTFFFKFIFAPILIAAPWVGILWSPIAWDFSWATLKWLLAVVFATVFVLWDIRPLRRVQIGGGKLWVSNYFKEISIPLEQVHTVYINRGGRIYATLHLRQETEFGWIIRFYPRGLQSILSRDKWEQEIRESLKPPLQQERIPAFDAK